ncbi:MAG: hypothetical protein FJX95_09880 [Bacteroidetes bacterium]|nr:hypothetical protein [Bacteroidota bacterium]
MSNKNLDLSNITFFKFRIVGMGSELAWMELDRTQLKYWSSLYKDAVEISQAQQELVNHIRFGSAPEENEKGYLGEYYNWDDEFEEYPYYEGSKLVIDLFTEKNSSDCLQTIEVFLDDERIEKNFLQGYSRITIDTKDYTKGVVFAKTEDRGEYCIGELDISEETNVFSLSNFNFYIEKIQGFQYVSMIEYNGEILDYEYASDPYNKDFNAWINWG